MNKKVINSIIIISTIILYAMGLDIFVREELFDMTLPISFLYILRIVIPLILISHTGICSALWYIINHK